MTSTLAVRSAPGREGNSRTRRHSQRRSTMDMRKYGAGPVRPEDVRDGPRREKIADVSISEKYDCPVLHFESGDQFMLFGNARTMCRAYTTDSNKWLDQEVELSLGHYTDNKGEEKETVVLTPISVLQPSADNGGTKAQAALPSRRDELDDEIPF